MIATWRISISRVTLSNGYTKKTYSTLIVRQPIECVAIEVDPKNQK